MSYQRWMQILKWATWPRFDHIHDLPIEDFASHYYVSPSLQEVIDNLYFCLIAGGSVSDKLFIGMPGAGKTTFIYWLMKVPHPLDGRELSKHYHFEVLHLNRIVTATIEESKNSIAERCLELYIRYLTANNFEEALLAINNNSQLSTTDKVNKILDFIKNNIHKFGTKLIIIIDDIDEAERNMVEPVLRLLYTYIEPACIQKWMAVRETTLGYYKQEFLNFIRTKFPEKIPFPRVDLNGIIENRIKANNPNGKNPFSHTICSQMIAAYNYDIREAMGVVNKFFELNKPGDTKDYSSDKFIENFFMIAFTKTLTKQKVFPNIYLRPISSRFTLEKDVFLLLCIKHIVDAQFLTILQKYYSDTLSTLRKKEDLYGSDSVTLSMEDIKAVTDFLYNNQLIEVNSVNCFFPTPKGQIFKRLITQSVYSEICEQEIKGENISHSKIFWILAGINPDFENFIW